MKSKKQTKEYFRNYYYSNKKYKCILCNSNKMNKQYYNTHLKSNIHQKNLKLISLLILKPLENPNIILKQK